MFHVIEFLTTSEVAVAPSNWIENGMCLWPPVKTPNKLAKMVANKVMPEENWERYQVRTIGEFATYEEARKRLKKAEDTSDLQSDAEKSRKRLKKRHLYESDSDEDSQSLLTPAPPVRHTLTEINNTFLHTPSQVTPALLTPAPPLRHTYMHTPSPVTPVPQTPSNFNQTHRILNQSFTPISHLNSTPTPSYDTMTSLNTQFFEEPSTSNTTKTCSCSQLHLNMLKSIQKELQAHTQILNYHSQVLAKLVNLHQNHPTETNQSAAATSTQSAPKSLPVNIPINSVEDLKVLEECLKEEGNFSEMVSYLASFGGDCVKKILKRILLKLLSHEVSLCLNWTGRNQKHQFEKYTRIHGAIYHAVKINAKEDVTLASIEAFIKDWFRFAADRNGGRQKRKNQTN